MSVLLEILGAAFGAAVIVPAFIIACILVLWSFRK